MNCTILYPLPCARNWQTTTGLQVKTKKLQEKSDFGLCGFNQFVSGKTAQSPYSGWICQDGYVPQLV